MRFVDSSVNCRDLRGHSGRRGTSLVELRRRRVWRRLIWFRDRLDVIEVRAGSNGRGTVGRVGVDVGDELDRMHSNEIVTRRVFTGDVDDTFDVRQLDVTEESSLWFTLIT